MKKLARMVWFMLFFCLLPGMIVTAQSVSTPSGKVEGGQVDDTDRSDLAAWLVYLNGGDALPHSGGQEVLAATIVENARSLVGKYPYVYGGESPEEGGFDCTGLVWYVYNRMSGLDITLSQAGRSKAALAAAGEKIYDHDAFLPGDVIQFTYAHVAIYVGGGRVVHARTTGTLIQETDLNYDKVEYAVRYPGVVQSVVLASGRCGEGVSWSLRTNGTLNITGSGAMENYAEETDVPWHVWREQIVSAVLEKSVTSIGDYAFYGCENLASVFATGIETIGLGAFYNCGALTELTISDCLVSIGRLAFNNCAGIKDLALPATLVRIDSGAFFGCSSLESVALPESLTEIGDMTFEKCSRLTRVTIPNGVTRVGESTFFGCAALTDVVLGGAVTTIDGFAFYGCVNLETITIPKTVQTIGDWSFGECTALAEVTYSGLAVQWAELSIGIYNESLLNAKLTCTGVPDAPQVSLDRDERVGALVLKWDEVKYAQRYEVWRAVGNGAFEFWSKVEGTMYYDLDYTPGTEHYYMIRAISGGRYSEWSEILVMLEPLRVAGTPPR